MSHTWMLSVCSVCLWRVKLFIACPVHYDTLYRGDGYEQYILECQKIPAEHKRFLFFMLLGIPAVIHQSNMYKFSVPLKSDCASLFAQIPLDVDVDFSMIRKCKFGAVGVRLKKSKGGEKEMLDKLNEFSERARKALIYKLFVLDVTSLSITTSVVCADYDLLGGSIIHENVFKPDSVYRFRHDNLFSDLIKTRESE